MPAPFSMVYFQLIEIRGEVPRRYLGRYVGPPPADDLQAELFSIPARMGLQLEALDLHVLPGWEEGACPPAWLKRLLTPKAWGWKDLPRRVVHPEDLGALKKEFNLSDSVLLAETA